MHYDFRTNANKLFNPLFYKLKKANTRILINYGGAGSGKSVAQHQLELLLQLDGSCNFDTLFIRKYSTDLHDSCYKLLENLAKQYQCKDEFSWTFSNAKRQIENKSTGHRILFKGIDDSEKLKSIVGIKRIVIEEASQLDFEDFLEINRRARGMEGIQIILLLNPINQNHWIKTKLLEGEGYKDRVTLFHTTHWDNKFLTEEDHQELENLKHVDENHYRVYAKGEWGIEDPNKIFAKDYRKELHFGKSFNGLYNPRLPLYLSWDFNIQNTCLAIQCDDFKDEINVLKEYHIKGYDLYMLSDLIQTDFPNQLYIINGDASGKGRSSLTAGNQSAYEILKGCFNLTWDDFIVPTVNPSHLNSRLLTNVIFKHGNVNISSECIELHNDLVGVEIDDRGSIDPYKKKHPERSHWLDPLRYHFNAHHHEKLTKYKMKTLQ